MKEKQYAIESLEGNLKFQEQNLEHYVGNLKELYGDISVVDANIVKARHCIKVLKDSILKLKGLYNLEKKNKVADSAEMTEEQFLRKEPLRTSLKWKHVEDEEIRKYIKDEMLPEIIKLLRDRQYNFHKQLKEALK